MIATASPQASSSSLSCPIYPVSLKRATLRPLRQGVHLVLGAPFGCPGIAAWKIGSKTSCWRGGSVRPPRLSPRAAGRRRLRDERLDARDRPGRCSPRWMPVRFLLRDKHRQLVCVVITNTNDAQRLVPEGDADPALGTALVIDGGSAGVPSAISSLNRKPAIRSSPPWSRTTARRAIPSAVPLKARRASVPPWRFLDFDWRSP
jgi:hypothetical protein